MATDDELQVTATLGLDTDEQEWSAADEAIKRMTTGLREMAVQAMLASTDVNKAMRTIALPGGKKSGGDDAKEAPNAARELTSQLIKLYAAARGAIGLKNTVTSVVELGTKLKDTHEQTGLSIQSMQELGHAAEMSSSSFEEITGGIKKFNRGLEEAKKTGKGDVADGLRSIGISMASAKKTLAGPNGMDVLLGQVADKFKEMPAGSKKTAAAMNLFSKSGANLIPFLNNGSEGLAELRQEAHDLGRVIDDESVDALKALGDEGDKLEATWDGLKRQMVVALIPTLRELVTAISDFVKENREAIKTTLTVVVKSLALAFGLLADVAGVVAKIFGFLVKHWEVGVAVLGVLAVLVAKFAAAWIVSMLPVAATTLAAFAPLLLVAALLTGIILVVKDVWKSITTGKGITADVARWIREKFRAVATAVQDAFSRAGAAVRQIWEDTIAWIQEKIDWVEKRIDALKHKLDEWADKVRELIGDDAAGVGAEFLMNQGAADPALSKYIVRGDGPGSSATNVNVGGIVVNSPNADPKQVADEVNKQLQDKTGVFDPADADVMK